MSIVPATFVRTGLLVLLTVVVQLSGFAQMQILGGYIDLIPLVVGAVAMLVAAYAALADGAELTDDAAVVRAAGVPVQTVDGDERAAKVTVAHDLAVAELAVRTTGERASPRSGGTSRLRGTASEERNEPGVEP